jgi:hypothetical protein
MKTLQQLKERAATIQARIDKLNGKTDITDEVGKAFYMGRVGGSGRNTYSLNRKRERALDRTIDDALEAGRLRNDLEAIHSQIKRIETESTEQWANKQQAKIDGRIAYWNDLKPGDSMLMGNGNIIVKKKNRKSFTCTSGINWSAAEIIGKQAAEKL